MKPLLLVMLLIAPLLGCAQLSRDAQIACAHQEAFNALAAGAVLAGPQAAAIGAAASAVVGVGCAWENAK